MTKSRHTKKSKKIASPIKALKKRGEKSKISKNHKINYFYLFL